MKAIVGKTEVYIRHNPPATMLQFFTRLLTGKSSYPSRQQMDDVFAALAYRRNMDRIIETYTVRVCTDPAVLKSTGLMSEVVAVSVFITEKVIELAGYNKKDLDLRQAQAASMITMIAADHISRLADLSYEATAARAIGVLWGDKFGPEKAAQILAEAVSRINAAFDHKEKAGAALLGKAIAKFFSTADIAALEEPKKIFSVTLRDL